MTSAPRGGHELPDVRGPEEDRLHPVRLPDRPVALGPVQWSVRASGVQQQVVGRQVSDVADSYGLYHAHLLMIICGNSF